jgi:molybdate transport system permease protein
MSVLAFGFGTIPARQAARHWLYPGHAIFRYTQRTLGEAKQKAVAFLTFSPEELTAIRLSLRVGFWAMLGSLPVALIVAMLLARGRFWGAGLLNIVVHLPLVMPPVVTGYLLLILFGRHGMLGEFLADRLGIVFAFRWTGAALASGVMGFPLMVRSIRLSLDGVDRRLEDAAATLGASRVWVWLTVTLPLILPGIVAGMILSFARALGEFGATITFVSNIPGETQTLPTAIYTLLQVPGGDLGALRLTLVAVAISMAALGLSEAIAQRASRRAAGL